MDNIFFSISLRKQQSLRLKKFFYGLSIIFVLFSTFSLSYADRKEIAPERDIFVVRDAPQSPDWKILWDSARKLVREAQYVSAADVYGQLFSIKPNIEEANWEYCKVLLHIESYGVASKIISLLLEKNPTKSEYLLVAGQVAAHQKNYAAAERYFGLIFEKSPTGTYGDAALKGLAYSLRSRGHKDLAFPLMHQLSVRQPTNKVLLHDLALDAVFLKQFDTARSLYRKLLAYEKVDDKVLFEAATVFDAQGFEKERNALLERYLRLHPEYVPFRKKLMVVSEQNDDYDTLMEHLSFFIENSKDKSDYLLKAAEVSSTYLKRPDKALGYLEQLRITDPGDREVLASINELQIQLANDFLIIVENGSADLLWDDLDSIGANRQSIFERMAALLEKQKKYLPLIDILEVLYQHGQDKASTGVRLAQLLNTVKKYELSQRYAALVPEKMRNADYYHLKADNETHLGLEFQSFNSLKKVLDFRPEDMRLRKQSIELAGRLGLVKDQIKLFNYLNEIGTTRISLDVVVTHVKLLALNQMYEEGLGVCNKAISANTTESHLIRLYLLKADLLRLSGSARGAEQLLRQLLHEKMYQNLVLLQLAENSIADGDLLMGRKWFDLFDSKKGEYKSAFGGDYLRNKKQLVHLSLLRLEGQFDEALERIDQILEEDAVRKNSGDDTIFISRLLKERGRLYLAAGNYPAAEKTLETELYERDFDPELFVLYENVLVQGNKDKLEGVAAQKLRRDNTVLFSRVMGVVEKEIENQAYGRAKQHFSLIDSVSNQSVRLKNLSIKLALADNRFESAKNDLQLLEESYGNEIFFCRQQIEVLAKAAEYQDALVKYKDCFPEIDTPHNIAKTTERTVEEKILYGRLLWGAKEYENSLAVYKELLDPPVYQLLIERFREKRIDYQYLTRQQSLWSSMMLLLESDPEIIAELMEPKFLYENLGNETGKIVTDFYEQYSWQKIIENEFSARNAIFNKNYHFAAKSYEKLLEKEKTTESKVDLATIYGRIGKFRKEAQVYEDISNVGEVTPELEESIKRNILQIRPTNTVDIQIEERNGREGSVDIRKTSLGSSFWFTPDLNKDFWLSYAYNQYETTDRRQEIDANIIRGAMTYEFASSYELITGLGAEKFNDSSENEIQYNFELKGQLDDYVSGFVLYEKEPVDDTVEALKEAIFRQFIQTGLTVETEVGITFGGDLSYSLYSDDNEQNRFYLFSSYSIFGESLQFDIRYHYQYLANKDVNDSEGGVSDDMSDDLVEIYWSPESYSEHRLGFQLKKDFYGYLTDVENKISYFRFDTGISLEDEENIAYSARFDIFLEMSPHLLLKGNFSFNSSDVYDEKMLSLSLHYSW